MDAGVLVVEVNVKHSRVFCTMNAFTGTRPPLGLGWRVPRLCSASFRCKLILRSLPIWLVLVVSTVRAQVPGSGVPSAPFAGAIISEWKGEVRIQLPSASVSNPKRGQVLSAGTVIETVNGRLVMVLRSDESEILVQPHTRLIIVEPAPGNWNALEIILGQVRAYIRKRTGGAASFQMGTPSAVIAVRGTRFDVEVNRYQVSEVDVFDGLVEVGSRINSGTSVLVSPGFSTRVGVGTAPETPVPTRELRPGVEVPAEIAKLEFAREQAAHINHLRDSEMGERPDSEFDESIDESRESEKEKH